MPAAGGNRRNRPSKVSGASSDGVDCATGKAISELPAIMAFARGGASRATPSDWDRRPRRAARTTAPGSASPRHLLFRFLAYNYDTSGAFAGSTAEVSANPELTDGGTKFTYAGTVQFFDAAGQPMFSVCGAATANRF